MNWLNLVLPLAALAAVGYLFYAKPWKAECEVYLHKAKRFAEDGDAVQASALVNEVTPIMRRVEELEKVPTRHASPEKPKAPRNVSFTAWRALAEQEEENTNA